jgi:integrase
MPDFVSKRFPKSIRKAGPSRPGEVTSDQMAWSLYDNRGRRKYLLAQERRAFLQAALEVGGKTASFCAVLSLTGARLSEVLALTPERLDESNGAINLDTLKRRRRGIIRAVPVPRKLFLYLEAVHHFRVAQRDPALAECKLWSWSRTTAWRRIKLVMDRAAQPAFNAKPKALRHAFGAEAALNRVPITQIKKWLGHARIETTEIYTTLLGPEERALAQRTWKNLPDAF